MQEIASKARLAYHLGRYMTQTGLQQAFFPETHIVSAKLQLGNERERLHQAAERAKADGRGTIWIVKPHAANRGIGITVHDSMGV
jgi:hypothetical protein